MGATQGCCMLFSKKPGSRILQDSRLFNVKSCLYIYIYQIYMICKYILLITFLNEPELILFCTQLNGFNYFYLIQIILFAQSAGAVEYTDCFSAEG